MKKALFLDRDGVINEDLGYVCEISKFQFKDGIFSFLKAANERGYELFVVTNQSGIGRGYYLLEDFNKVTEFMLSKLQEKGILIKKVYFCPHSPDEHCECRKPKIGMIINARDEFGLDLGNSALIGDKISDIAAGFNAGIGKLFLLNSSENSQIPHTKARNFDEILTEI